MLTTTSLSAPVSACNNIIAGGGDGGDGGTLPPAVTRYGTPYSASTDDATLIAGVLPRRAGPAVSGTIRVFGMHDSVPAPALVTPWSLFHAAMGAGFAFATIKVVPSIPRVYIVYTLAILHLLYEFKDAYKSYRRYKYDNSVFNSMVDHAFALTGAFVVCVCESVSSAAAPFCLAWTLFVAVFLHDSLFGTKRLG